MTLPDLSKATQLSKHRRRRKKYADVPDVPESALQGQMDDLLDAMQIEYRRIPDAVWRSMKQLLPSWVIKELADRWKSKPDTLILIPIDDKYCLAREVEIKSKKGKPSPRQAAYAERMPVTMSRSTAENEAIVRETLAEAERLKGFHYEFF